MFAYEHSLESDATPEAIYALYRDVITWPIWDAGVAAAEIAGPFAAGTTGVITPAGGEPLPFSITDARPGEGFADETQIPGAVIRFEHVLTPLAAGKTRITHRVAITGPAAEAIGQQLGPVLTAGIPATIAALAAMARRTPAK